MDSRLPSEEATTNQGWHHSDTPPMAQESAGRGASAPARAPPHQSRDEAAPARANRATCASARGARARGRRCGSRRRSAATAAKAAPQASAAPQPTRGGKVKARRPRGRAGGGEARTCAQG
jgi:hypothetical protein